MQFCNRTKLTPIKKWVAVAVCLSIAISLSIYEVKRYPSLPFDLGESPAIPKHAIDFLKQIDVQGNIYNFLGFGGYLTWRLYPERKVFIDGRLEIYNRDFQNAFIIGPSPHNWNKAIGVYDINYALVAYTESKVDRIAGWISEDPDWILIYWDDVAKIYVRNLPGNQRIIDRYAHKVFIDPLHFNHKTLKDSIADGRAIQLESELLTDIESNSKNNLARYWLGMLYHNTPLK